MLEGVRCFVASKQIRLFWFYQLGGEDMLMRNCGCFCFVLPSVDITTDHRVSKKFEVTPPPPVAKCVLCASCRSVDSQVNSAVIITNSVSVHSGVYVIKPFMSQVSHGGVSGRCSTRNIYSFFY